MDRGSTVGKSPIRLPAMFSNSLHNLEVSKTSPAGFLFFSFPAEIQMKANGLRTEVAQYKHAGS